MRWRKRGLVYVPAGNSWWTKNRYAFNPTVEVLSDDLLRVYFAALDEHRYGRIGYVELDANEPQQIRYVTNEPVLDLGPLGGFDDSGVNPSCVIEVGGRKHLYYIGWQRCERVPYMLFSGLATSDDSGRSFKRYAPVPVFNRTETEPYSRSAPCVLSESGRYRAWYWSCERWSVEDDWVHYNNVIRHAESADGVNWQSTEHICLAPSGPLTTRSVAPGSLGTAMLIRCGIRSEAAPKLAIASVTPNRWTASVGRAGMRTWVSSPRKVVGMRR